MIQETEVKDFEREQRLSCFISNLRDEGVISDATALRVWDIWKRLSEATNNALRVPDASAGPDDGFIFLWNRSEHHLELEIFPDGTMEFFYRNRTSGSLWGVECQIGETLTQEVLDKLAIFS